MTGFLGVPITGRGWSRARNRCERSGLMLEETYEFEDLEKERDSEIERQA